MTLETQSPTEDLARALARFIAAAPALDPWAKYPPVLTATHVAEILGIDPNSVGESARRGRIPMRKRMGKWLVDQAVFRSWLASEESA